MRAHRQRAEGMHTTEHNLTKRKIAQRNYIPLERNNHHARINYQRTWALTDNLAKFLTTPKPLTSLQ